VLKAHVSGATPCVSPWVVKKTIGLMSIFDRCAPHTESTLVIDNPFPSDGIENGLYKGK
jgi:hypothetical protein